MKRCIISFITKDVNLSYNKRPAFNNQVGEDQNIINTMSASILQK